MMTTLERLRPLASPVACLTCSVELLDLLGQVRRSLTWDPRGAVGGPPRDRLKSGILKRALCFRGSEDHFTSNYLPNLVARIFGQFLHEDIRPQFLGEGHRSWRHPSSVWDRRWAKKKKLKKIIGTVNKKIFSKIGSKKRPKSGQKRGQIWQLEMAKKPRKNNEK